MDYKNIKYLTCEGGGGKAIAYTGAIYVLEALGVLPYRNPKIIQPNKPLNQIKGIAGTSGGAITSFLLALGCGGDDIRKIVEDGEELGKFYDEPSPGYYRAVKYDKETKKNISGFSADKYTSKVDVMETFSSTKDPYKIPEDEKIVDKIISNADFFTISENEAKKRGRVNSKIMEDKLELKGTAKAARSWIRSKVKDSELAPVIKIFSNKLAYKEYIYCLMFDRGFFSGAYARDFFREKLMYFLDKNFDYNFAKDLDEDDKHEYYSNFTFQQLFDITELNLKLYIANITTGKPMEFSHEKTPDFPVADAVSMSMSIPGAFKPTFVNAKVFISETDEYNWAYNGFYVDGGCINNFPIHAFDKTLGELDPGMFGIRSTGGVDRNFLHGGEDNSFYTKDNYFGKDNLFLSYFKEKDSIIRKNENNNSTEESGDNSNPQQPKGYYQRRILFEYEKKTGNVRHLKGGLIETDLNAKHSFSVFGDFLGNLYNSIMYHTEDGQIRNEEEEHQTIQLYSYDVGIFDFDLSEPKYLKKLSKFVQRTAGMKTAFKFDFKEFTSFKKVIDFYKLNRDNEILDEKKKQTFKIAETLFNNYHDNVDGSK